MLLRLVAEKGFVKESDLHLHMKCHSTEKSYTCEVCGDAFKFKTNLEHHGILKHGLGTEEQRYVTSTGPVCHAIRFLS